MKHVEVSDLNDIRSWYEKREKPVPTGDLPKVGFIEPNVACGFLYQTDSDFCLIEGYATNPEAESKMRNEALNAITAALIEAASSLGFKKVYAITKETSISGRAVNHGFREIDQHQVLIREF